MKRITFEASTRILIAILITCTTIRSSFAADNETKLENQTILEESSYRCSRRLLPPIEQKERCCSGYQDYYRANWYSQGLYLTGFLTTLKFWNCSNFEQVCDRRRYDFTDFTTLVYDHFCSSEKVKEKCYDRIKLIVERGTPNKSGMGESSWAELTRDLDPLQMEFDELKDPCTAIALFERPLGGVGRFHEIIDPFVPFCDILWAGYAIDTAMKGNVTVWNNISSGCQAGIIICMILNIIVGVAVIISNITVIIVYLSNKALRNSQAIYKISIAFGDLIVGVLIFPCTIAFQYLSIFAPSKMGDIRVTDPLMNTTQSALETRKDGRRNDFLSVELVMSIGLFTTSSVLVSMYTLLTASFDRFRAVYRPLSYDKHAAMRQAKYWCSGVWLLAIAAGLVPVFVSDMEYNLIASSIVIPEGEPALIFLVVVFLLPLVVLWCFNVATYRAAMKHAKKRRQMLASSSTTDKMEIRLARTLVLMVGVYSVCTFPAIVILVLPHFLGNINFGNPENVDLNTAKVFNSVEYCGAFILLTNSLWNCFIYSLRGKDFQNASKKLYKGLSKTLRLDLLCNCSRRIVSSARRKSDETATRKTSTTHMHGANFTKDAAGRPTTSSSSGKKEASTSTSMKETSSFDNTVQESRERKDKNVSEDPSFGSFALEEGADRLFVSVMDQIDEQIEL